MQVALFNTLSDEYKGGIALNNQSAVNILRFQYSESQDWLMGTMEGVTDEVAHYVPPGSVNSIAAQLAHVVTELDFYLVGMVAGKEPLLTSSFAGKSGISEPPAADSQHEWLREWGKTIRVDLSTLQEYRQAVFTEIDNYLATLTDNDLQKELITGRTILSIFDTLLRDIAIHTGEISCIKGLQDLKGYPV